MTINSKLNRGPKIIDDYIVNNFSSTLSSIKDKKTQAVINSETNIINHAINEKVIIELLNNGLNSVDIIEHLTKQIHS